VIARDVTCTFPGCRTPATRCEIDHRIPYDFTPDPEQKSRTHGKGRADSHAPAPAPALAGTGTGTGMGMGMEHRHQTCEANLHSLCKHHHQAKTEGWWNVVYDPATGISRWTDRHGITYARHPARVLVPPDALRHRAPPAPPSPPGAGPAPF
jgi:hypothetical protein